MRSRTSKERGQTYSQGYGVRDDGSQAGETECDQAEGRGVDGTRGCDDRGICSGLQSVTGWIAGTCSGACEFIGTQHPSMLEHH